MLAYEMVDYYNEKTNHTAMMRTTAYPASIVAIMIAKGEVVHGVHTNETAVNPDKFVKEMKKRGLDIRFAEGLIEKNKSIRKV